ncbi:MAG: inositol monophosphatase family protein [Cardiobacteriaceae bacterium]|nr:inositol monophosphatase family protein [Cardiobacteriaceae bacterium]
MKHPMLTIAKRAAEEAGNIIVRGFRQLDQIQVQEKGRADLVSWVDQQAEVAIRSVLSDKFPSHQFLGEEMGASGADAAEYLWVIDPLDGTTNFLHGLPHFAVSIALVKQGKLELGLVYNPISEEWFTAARGEGALLNGRRLRVNALREPSRAIVATGFPTRTPERLPEQYALVSSVLEKFGDIRRLGAAALDLCYVACGRQDGYFELGIKPWDIAAGVLIAQEAGAIVTDFKGETCAYDSERVVCANAYLHKQLLSQVQKISAN